MKQLLINKTNNLLSVKTATFLIIGLFIFALINSAFISNDKNAGDKLANTNSNPDSLASAKAFLQVYKVLMSPRCMNCHPSGDIPLQGDDNHLHIMLPRRGKDGHGVYAMKCSNCHQPTNTPGLHTPPGNPKWGLPPADMRMVFQGRTAHQLALQIADYNRNGHKNKQQLLEHARDTLVKAAWYMGEGRNPPPLAYGTFLKVWDTWIKKGAYAPK